MKSLKSLLSVLVNPILILPALPVIAGAILIPQAYNLEHSEVKHEYTRVVDKSEREAFSGGYILQVAVKCKEGKIFGIRCSNGKFCFEVRPSTYEELEVGQEVDISYKSTWGREYRILNIK